MKEQLRFDLWLLKNRKALLGVVGILDVLILFFGLIINMVSVDMIYIFTIFMNAIITIIYIYMLNTHVNKSMQIKTNTLACMYFPTTTRIYILSKYIFTILLAIVQVLVVGATIVIGNIVSEKSMSMLLGVNIVVITVETILIVSGIMLICCFLMSNFLNIMYIFIGGITGGVVGLLEGGVELQNIKSMFIGLGVIFLIWILLFEISRFITSRLTP